MLSLRFLLFTLILVKLCFISDLLTEQITKNELEIEELNLELAMDKLNKKSYNDKFNENINNFENITRLDNLKTHSKY